MKVEKIAVLGGDNIFVGEIPVYFSSSFLEMERLLAEGEGYVESRFQVRIGQGAAKRTLTLETIIPQTLIDEQNREPIMLNAENEFTKGEREFQGCFIFKNGVYLVSTKILEAHSEEEATLLIKKQVLSQNSRLEKLRQEVDILEKITYKRFTRISIPENVKLLVFARDEGKCVRCDSRETLHFDHIIPVSKGGGNSEQNIQILCDTCNLRKSNNIAFK